MKASRILLSILKFVLVFFFAFVGAVPLAKAATNLPFGQVTTGTIASAAQTNEYTFSANAGDVLNFTVFTTTSTSGTLGPCLALYDPNNKQVDSAGGNYNRDIQMFGYAATLTGTYTLLIRDCVNTATGNYSAFLQKTNAPIGASTLPFATVTTGQISAAAQSIAYTFSANANDVLNFTAFTTASTAGTLGPCLMLYNTTGTPMLDSAGGNYNGDVQMFGYQVKTTGTFNLLVRDCADSATGTMKIFLQKTNAPISAASILYSQQQPASIASASQSNAYTFIGTANDVLNFTAVTNKSTSGTLGPCFMVYNTTGTPELASAGGNYNTNVTLNYKVPATGTYNVFLRDCADSATGNYTLSVTCLGACLLPAPAISAISPSSVLAGSSGFTLTVNGSNFVNVNAQSVVQWNGADLTTTFVNTGQLTAQVPMTDVALAGNFPITVFTPTPGGGTSNSKTFAVTNPKPTLSSIAPTSATVGGASFTLTVNGSGFNSQSVVYWNKAALAITSVSSTVLKATVPASDLAAAGTASVTVTNPTPGGGSTSASTFTVNNPSPVLTKISPTTITAGNASATTLTVTGTGFVKTSAVDWKGAGMATTYVSGTQLTASIPASNTACGTAQPITVVNATPGGGMSSALTFTANNPVPALTSISPNNIAAGSGSFTLTVNGSSFLKNCSVVQWNGTSLKTTFVSASQLTAIVPATDDASNGTAKVTVNNPAPGGGTTVSQTFTVGPFPVPTLTSITPTSATAGGSGFTLTLNGSNFVPSSKVYWNGTALPSSPTGSSTQLTISVPASAIAAAGYFPVTVVNPTPGGGTSGSQTFTVNNPVPTVSSMLPNATPAGGSAFTLTVNGSKFVSSSVVKWNTTSLTPKTVSASQLTVTIPAADIAATGTATVTVMNPAPGGGTASPSLLFTIQNPLAATPVISPTAGSYGYAFLFSITDATPGATIYYTTNGTAPTTSSTVYKTPVLLSSSATIEAMATAPNFTNSPAASSAFVIGGTALVLAMPAVSVTSSGATLRTLVNGRDLAGTVSFAYGASSTALNSATPAQTLNPSNNGVVFQAPLTGLSAGATYYYQAVVKTAGGTSSSAILSFTTP